MKNFIISIIIFLLWTFSGMWWYYSCPMCSNEEGNNSNVTEKEATILSPKEDVIVKTYNGFNIANVIDADIFDFQEEMHIFNYADSIGIVLFPEKTMQFKDSIFAYLTVIMKLNYKLQDGIKMANGTTITKLKTMD